MGLVAPHQRRTTSGMLAIPQVELRSGACVRSAAHSGNGQDHGAAFGNALGLARSLAADGFHRIHLVDRDAVLGNGSNSLLVDEIVRDGSVEVQINDAAESGDEIERLVSAGAVRVVLGPRWLDEPDWLSRTAEFYPGMLIVATAVRERRAVTRGRGRGMPMAVLDVVADLSGVPLGGLLVSFATSEGHRSGADLALIEDISEASDAPLIVDGGVRDMSDLRALEHRGVSAVLLGEQLHRGELDARAVAMEFGEA